MVSAQLSLIDKAQRAPESEQAALLDEVRASHGKLLNWSERHDDVTSRGISRSPYRSYHP